MSKESQLNVMINKENKINLNVIAKKKEKPVKDIVNEIIAKFIEENKELL